MVKGSKFFLCNLDFDFIKLLGLFLYLHLNDRLATGLIMIYLYKCHGIIANAEKIIQFVTIMMEWHCMNGSISFYRINSPISQIFNSKIFKFKLKKATDL